MALFCCRCCRCHFTCLLWNQLMQFISGITPDAVQILRAADKLEKDLVQIAVEDSVDCDDGGKAIIREMPPYEAEGAMAETAKVWIKTRVERLKEWVDRNHQQELPIPTNPALLPDLMTGLDKCLQYYVTKVKSGCGSRSSYIPTMPALTRCTTEAKFQWKKKDKSINAQKKNPQVATVNGGSSWGVQQLCVRINTLHKIRMELEVVEKRIVTLSRNSESANLEDFSNGLSKSLNSQLLLASKPFNNCLKELLTKLSSMISAILYGTHYMMVTLHHRESSTFSRNLRTLLLL